MVIERTFGVIKRRFKLFRERTEYPLETQARIIPALCAIHNFILTYDAEDGLSPDNGDIAEGATINEVWAGGVSNAERERATETRDKIATEMWKNYSTSLSSVAP
ncbi:hypothetical protein BOTBODRAFT_40019 [Botryobasidium botryosum FD-172 SS1]|uniref:DDE Tnp4 domain-containing protein n=1 Tax=Botryobasidium botryosum (strain FD-172 SS1) TaxID=930990 RepID=A0A067M0Y3_BOTB1|nr:hypothetical protein BOTBODRAFT_40019 [Botryobasidium botryosum FD-172 SS1]